MDDKHEYFEKHGTWGSYVNNSLATMATSACRIGGSNTSRATSGVYYAPSPNYKNYINCSYCGSVNCFKGENLNCRQCAAPLDLKKMYVS